MVALPVWQALFHYAWLQTGQRILFHAVAEGVGHIAVQRAKQRGAYIIVTARTHDNDFVRRLGADEVISVHAFTLANWLSIRKWNSPSEQLPKSPGS